MASHCDADLIYKHQLLQLLFEYRRGERSQLAPMMISADMARAGWLSVRPALVAHFDWFEIGADQPSRGCARHVSRPFDALCCIHHRQAMMG
jgi:hypothetical protein